MEQISMEHIRYKNGSMNDAELIEWKVKKIEMD
jgi:hypothetical protein